MYRIVSSDGTVLYDQSHPGMYLLTEVGLTREVNQAGSLQFTIYPQHDYYDSIEPMVTYLSAEEDGEEIFYGRVIDVNVDHTSGIMHVECAGALSFLDDGEYKGHKEAQTMTYAAMFRACINAYNSDIGDDPKRTLSVGTISHSKSSSSRSFNIQSNTKAKSAIESFVLRMVGGFIRVRKTNNGRVVDWIEHYSEPNDSPIELQNNVLSLEDALTANDMYTVLRPIGKDWLTLSGGGTINLSQALVTKYGKILKTVNFNAAETESELRSQANAYIASIGKGIGKTSTIGVADMHFFDNTVHRLTLGAVYDNIKGFEGEDMMIAAFEQNFDDPSQDTITLKNEKELATAEMIQDPSGKSAVSGGRGSYSSSAAKTFENVFEHITETENSLSIHAQLIELHGEQIVETATEFERYSRDTDNAIGTIEGSGVLQNSDTITQVVGNFTRRWREVTNGELHPDPEHPSSDRNPKAAGYCLAMDYVALEEDLDTGIELYLSVAYATRGEAVPTSSKAEGHIIPGNHYIRMEPTNDETPISGRKYYTRVLAINNGSSFVMTREGTEFGLYDEGILTGGIMVDKINNDGTVVTKILGNRVDIEASQVRVGNTTNVEAWLEEQGEDIDDLDGKYTLVTNGIAALEGKFQRIYTEDLSGITLTCDTLDAVSITGGDFDGENVKSSGYVKSGDFILKLADEHVMRIVDITKSQDGQTLTIYRYNGSTVESITFNKATTGKVTLSGAWSGRYYTASAVPSTSATPPSVTGIVYSEIVPVYGTEEYDSTSHAVSRYYKVFSEDINGDADELLINQKLSISADKAVYDGKYSVTINPTVNWATAPATNISVNQNAATISTQNRTNRNGSTSNDSLAINLYSSASTSGLKATFYAYHTSTAATNAIMKREVTCSDSNLKAANIKKDVSIFGVTGTYDIDSTEAYYAGSASVLIDTDVLWTTTPSSSINVNTNTVTVSTKNRTDASGTPTQSSTAIKIVSSASTSGLTATFYACRSTTDAANRILKRTATCSDSNLTAGNIKSGVEIFGVTGTYTGSHSITISPDTVGKSSDPGSSYTELWSSTNFVKNRWYVMTVKCGGTSKRYKIHMTGM